MKKLFEAWASATATMRVTVIIGIIYLAAWAANGYAGTHFSCSDLLAFYGAFIVQRAAIHGIDSALNSPKGEAPARPDR